jgi:hypothetical protein
VNRAIIFGIIGLALSNDAYASEKMICSLSPANNAEGWHYRTKIKPRPESRCWYAGERMKPRSELYWSEAPAIAPSEVPTDRPPWAVEYRWQDPNGSSHKE